jgi:hypothetical protein
MGPLKKVKKLTKKKLVCETVRQSLIYRLYSYRKVGQKSCDMSQNFHFQVLGPVSPAFGAVREKWQLFHPLFLGSGWGKIPENVNSRIIRLTFPAEKFHGVRVAEPGPHNLILALTLKNNFRWKQFLADV